MNEIHPYPYDPDFDSSLISDDTAKTDLSPFALLPPHKTLLLGFITAIFGFCTIGFFTLLVRFF